MKLDRFFKIGKDALMNITRVQNPLEFNKETEIKKAKPDSSICKKCPLYTKSMFKIKDIDFLKYKRDYCNNYCEKRKNNINSFNGEEEFVGIVKKRLSRLQLCQFLLYHSLGVGPNGIVKGVSEKEVASILGCTVKTVRNNNERLINLNYVLLSKYSNDKFNVLILGYNKYHLPSEKGGRGYITMSSKSLIELINIKNVNSLRIELRNLVKFDDSNIKRIKTREVSLTYSEISFFLPGYMNHKAAIDRALDNMSKMFKIKKTKEKIHIALKNEYNGKLERRKMNNRYKTYFKDYCNKRNLNLNKKDYDDLLQMSLEYRFNKVIDALDIIYKDYYLAGINIENYGGLVREIIKNKMLKSKLA